MLLVDDDDPDIGERRQDREPRPDDDVDVAAADAPPLVGALAVAEPRMDDRHPGVEVGAEPVDERERQRDLGDQDERAATGAERRRDRLHVDRRLAAAGHAVEEQRRRVGGRDRLADQGQGRGLRRQQVRRRRASTAQPDRAAGERAAGSLADLRVQQAATDEPGDGRRPVPTGQLGAGDATDGVRGGHLGQRGHLPRSERPSRGPISGRQRRGRLAPGVRRADPALVARPGRGAEQRPVERDQVRRGERPEPARQPGPALRGGQRAGRPGPARQLIEEVEVHRRQRRRRDARHTRRPRRELGDQLEPLEHPGWEHRPEDECRRGQVVGGDPAGERQPERGQERSVGPDPVHDGLRGHAGRRSALAEDDAEGLPPPELHEDGLAGLEVGERLRDEIRVRPVPAGARRVDGDLHQPRPGGPRRLVGGETERHDQAPRRGPVASGGGRASPRRSRRSAARSARPGRSR